MCICLWFLPFKWAKCGVVKNFKTSHICKMCLCLGLKRLQRRPETKACSPQLSRFQIYIYKNIVISNYNEVVITMNKSVVFLLLLHLCFSTTLVGVVSFAFINVGRK